MAILKWDPWNDLVSMHQELNRVFEKVFSPEGRGIRSAAWIPAIDMFERDGALVVRAELPGIKAEDVDISVVDDTLSIQGERKIKEEVKEDNYYRMEQRYGSFKRVIQLPAKAKVEDVKAVFAEGVLEITLPRAEEEKPRQIKIQIEGES